MYKKVKHIEKKLEGARKGEGWAKAWWRLSSSVAQDERNYCQKAAPPLEWRKKLLKCLFVWTEFSLLLISAPSFSIARIYFASEKLNYQGWDEECLRIKNTNCILNCLPKNQHKIYLLEGGGLFPLQQKFLIAQIGFYVSLWRGGGISELRAELRTCPRSLSVHKRDPDVFSNLLPPKHTHTHTPANTHIIRSPIRPASVCCLHLFLMSGRTI